MSHLDLSLETLLHGRREKNRYRSLKEYDTSSPTGLADFVSLARASRAEARIANRTVF